MTKIVLITGATQGIGLSLAKWFIKKGHKVIGCGRSQKIIEELNELYKNMSLFSVVDVSDKNSVKKWANESITSFGAPDLILNNAAIAPEPKNLWEVPLDEFDKAIDVNLKGVTYVIHFFLPAMLEAKKGVIINFSSGWGRSTASQTATYCCTKWGVEGLSLALAQELPPPLACAPLNPGTINTDMLEKYFGEMAGYSRGPDEWADTAGPYLLKLDRSCNGKQLTAP